MILEMWLLHTKMPKGWHRVKAQLAQQKQTQNTKLKYYTTVARLD
jgi:hypothetical protein